MMEVSRVTEVRFYQMLQNHTVMEGIQHVTSANKPSSLQRELADPEEPNRSPKQGLQFSGRRADNFRGMYMIQGVVPDLM